MAKPRRSSNWFFRSQLHERSASKPSARATAKPNKEHLDKAALVENEDFAEVVVTNMEVAPA